jgi:hypothetical protein
MKRRAFGGSSTEILIMPNLKPPYTFPAFQKLPDDWVLSGSFWGYVKRGVLSLPASWPVATAVLIS